MAGARPDDNDTACTGAADDSRPSWHRAGKPWVKLMPLSVLVTMTLLNHLAMMATRITVILYAIEQHASPAVIGVLGALFSAVGIVISVPAGRWAQRAGARIPMVVGCVASGIGALLGFLAPGLATLFVISIVVGTFNIVYFVVSQDLVGHYGKPEDRVGNFSLFSLAFSIGSFIGPLIAGYAIESLGHPTTFLLFAIVSFVPGAFLHFTKMQLPSLPPKSLQRQDEPSRKAREPDPDNRSTLRLLIDPKLRPIYLITATTQTTWNIFSLLLPIYLANHGQSASRIGITISSYYLATIVSRLFLPLAARRFNAWTLVLLSVVISGLIFVGYTVTANIIVIITLSVCLGLVTGLVGPLTLALVHDASPPGRSGEAVGVRVTLQTLFSTLIPLLAGAAGATIGLAAAFWITGAVLMSSGWTARRQALLAKPRV